MIQMKRAILNEVLSRKPEQPLYHYTTQRGLIGIIKSREMWVTHTQYLNDRREFVHAVDLARAEIKRLSETSSTNSARKETLQRMEQVLNWSPQSVNVCVCSFSENRDSLSQWRAYGAGTSGFAIGFPADLLVAAASKKNWCLAPCIYDPKRQREIMQNLVEEVLEENLSGDYGFTPEDDDELEIVRARGGNFLADLNRYAPILKDESFSEEREWRIISRPLMSSSKDFCFREGQSLLIPYSKFPLSYDDLKCRLTEVVIGPTRDQERSKSSVTSFLIHERLLKGTEVGVEISKVPFRDW
jgi:hypothetical protein